MRAKPCTLSATLLVRYFPETQKVSVLGKLVPSLSSAGTDIDSSFLAYHSLAAFSARVLQGWEVKGTDLSRLWGSWDLGQATSLSVPQSPQS
jgi:hypothetical protein